MRELEFGWSRPRDLGLHWKFPAIASTGGGQQALGEVQTNPSAVESDNGLRIASLAQLLFSVEPVQGAAQLLAKPARDEAAIQAPDVRAACCFTHAATSNSQCYKVRRLL
jgi:hypothetical protein